MLKGIRGAGRLVRVQSLGRFEWTGGAEESEFTGKPGAQVDQEDQSVRGEQGDLAEQEARAPGEPDLKQARVEGSGKLPGKRPTCKGDRKG